MSSAGSRNCLNCRRFEKERMPAPSCNPVTSCMFLRHWKSLALAMVAMSGFFWPSPSRPVEARQLGAALISHTCDRTRQLSLASYDYDRLFPNQDTMPKGGFGNLIALPLQKQSREKGRSVLVDENFDSYPDQWAYLASIRPISRMELEEAGRGIRSGVRIRLFYKNHECGITW